MQKPDKWQKITNYFSGNDDKIFRVAYYQSM